MENFKKFRDYLNITQEELANKLSLDRNTIALYEADKRFPSFNNILKLVRIFDISLDFFLLNKNCSFPRNIKLLNLAKKIDFADFSDDRNSLERTVKSLMGEKKNLKIEIKQDLENIPIKNNFKENLKIMRNLKELTQQQLADSIDVSKSTYSLYEIKNHPPADKLIKLSEVLQISINALATGNRLFFKFNDGIFGDTILLADQTLELEDHKILIRLMEAILKNQPVTS
mgnify:CR=1 FL=1